MNDLQDRRAGLVLGSLIADSLSLGVHWIYDTDKLLKKFGYVDQYYAPGADSYHPDKKAGEQSHVGDQALTLAEFLNQTSEWDKIAFMEEWSSMWVGYSDYFDHATKATLQNIQDGKAATKAGSSSNELAGPARIAPLVAKLAECSESEVAKACAEQTELTHASLEASETTAFLARSGYQLVHGAALKTTIRENAPSWALTKAESVLKLDAVQAIANLGQSCPIPSALPAVIYLALKYGDDLPKAFSENAMAGGDNCARALALGMLLGAAHGANRIPAPWREELRATDMLLGLSN